MDYGNRVGAFRDQLFLKNLDELAEPKRTGTNLLNLPGKSYIMYEPLGVVLIIAPWNYPFQLSLIPLIGALAAGNCAVLKPSEVAMATEAVIQKIVAETFAPQYVSFASGNGADVVPGDKIFPFRSYFLYRSTAVGKAVYQLAAEQLVPATLELGAKVPALFRQKPTSNWRLNGLRWLSSPMPARCVLHPIIY